MKNTGTVLLIDDDAEMLDILRRMLESSGFGVEGVLDGVTAVSRAAAKTFEVVVVDLIMPGLSGLETIRQIKNLSRNTAIIVLTGNPSVNTAISALREHIFDYLCKPQDIGRLKTVVHNAVAWSRQHNTCEQQGVEQDQSKEADVPSRMEFAGIEPSQYQLIGSSPVMSRIRELIDRVAPTGLTVLIRGETGTGKEIVARKIHVSSGRFGRGAFTKINCPAVPDHLLESEMFGHEKGAFTGALTQRVGRFEQSAHGTILLDEIGAISLSAQSKLLEAVEQKEFMRLGGHGKIRVDARVLAATNAPLEEMVEKGQFRADLIYRLQQFKIQLPALREHREDIPELAHFLLDKYEAKFLKPVPELPPDLMLRLSSYEWPGNVRQLDAVLLQYCVTEDVAVIEECLASGGGASGYDTGHFLEKCEVNAIRSALSQSHGNQRRAAALLGLSYSAMRRRIAKYRVELCRD